MRNAYLDMQYIMVISTCAVGKMYNTVGNITMFFPERLIFYSAGLFSILCCNSSLVFKAS